MKSRVHPKYQTKYRVSNWAEYDQALVQRGDVTLWISEDAVDDGKPAPSGGRGGQRKFLDHAIETALALRFVFNLPLRQAEGFLRSIISMMGVNLEAPDHTTLSRRSRCLTDGNADDSNAAVDLIDKMKVPISGFTADAAYDTTAIYEAAAVRGAKVIVPPRKTATSPSRSRRSDESWRLVVASGRRNPSTTTRPASRTPSSDTSRSSVTGSGLVIPNRRRLKR